MVAERLGFDWDEALTLGRAVAGLNAYAKGVSLGLFMPSAKAVEEHRAELKSGKRLNVDLLHRAVPVTRTPEGLRAVSKERPMAPTSVARYLESKFGEALDDVRAAMTRLARSLSRPQLAKQACALYEEFRPAVSVGVRGWGALGELDVESIIALSRRAEGAKPG